jgi:hypothetical protein
VPLGQGALINTPLQNTFLSPYCRPIPAPSAWPNTTIESSTKGTEEKMRKYASKILALMLLVGVAQTLAGCVIEEDHDRYYHHHYWHDDDDGWHHHR